MGALDHSINLFLTPSANDWLTAFATTKGVTKSEVVRRALRGHQGKVKVAGSASRSVKVRVRVTTQDLQALQTSEGSFSDVVAGCLERLHASV